MNTYEANQSSIEKDRRGNGEFGFKEHGEPAGGTGKLGAPPLGLDISPEVDDEHVRQLSAAGLQGRVEPCLLRNPDLPSDAVVFWPAGGHYGMVLGNLGKDTFAVWDDLDTDGEAWRVEDGGTWDPDRAAETIRHTSFEREVRDELHGEFSYSDDYELRDASMWKDDEGDLYAQINVTDEEGTSIDVTYDFTRDELTARDQDDRVVDAWDVAQDCHSGEDNTREGVAGSFRKTAQKLVEAGHGKYIG